MFFQILECEFYLLELMVSGGKRCVTVCLCFVDCVPFYWMQWSLFIFFCPGLLSDSVPPVQTVVAVCAGYGTGGYAAAPGLVWDSLFADLILIKVKDNWTHKILPARLTQIIFIFTRRIVNDTYRTDLCLLYPPFMIALGKIWPHTFLLSAI